MTLPPSAPPPTLPTPVGACHSLHPVPGFAVLPVRVSSFTLPCATHMTLPNFDTALAASPSETYSRHSRPLVGRESEVRLVEPQLADRTLVDVERGRDRVILVDHVDAALVRGAGEHRAVGTDDNRREVRLGQRVQLLEPRVAADPEQRA